MAIAARKMKVVLPADLAIDAEVELWIADGEYFLRAPFKREPAWFGAQRRAVDHQCRGAALSVF
jgi:hypothetical protein